MRHGFHGFTGEMTRGFGERMGNGGYIFPWAHLMDLAFIIILVIILYMMFKAYKKNISVNAAIEVLNIKFANGEISEEEYINKKNLIKTRKIKKV